jgi:hypothetical protein
VSILRTNLDLTIDVADDAGKAEPLRMRVRGDGCGISVEALNDHGQLLGGVSLDYHGNRLQGLVDAGWDNEPVVIHPICNEVATARKEDLRHEEDHTERGGNAEDAKERAAEQAEGVTVNEPAEMPSSQMHCCVLTLRIPVTVFDDPEQRFTDADLPLLERYLWSVLNEREELTDALGRPAWGRLCLAGELFRHALDMMCGALGPKRPLYFARVPAATSTGEQFEISLERLVEP